MADEKDKNLSLLDEDDTDAGVDEDIDDEEDFEIDETSDEEDTETDETDDGENDEEDDDIDDVDLDEDDELDESDNDDGQGEENNDGSENGDDNGAEENGQDDKDAIINSLKQENSKLREQAKETLEKLGIKVGDNVEEALEQAAAESDGISVEEYRRNKSEAAEIAQAKETVRRQKFEELAANDLAELKKSFPDLLETKQIKDAFANIDEFAKFGRLRDSGIDAKTAYLAVKGDDIRAKQSVAATQKAVNDGKGHITSVAPKKASGDSVTMPKEILREWRDMFPDKSDKEIMRLYKKTL